MKGVSAIIATILMLIITIGLAGTAYMYISGVMTTRTAVTLSVSDVTCEGPASGDDMNIIVFNDGTGTAAAADLTIYINGVDASAQCTGVAVSPHSIATQTCTEDATDKFASGANEIRIVHGPTGNVARGIAYC